MNIKQFYASLTDPCYSFSSDVWELLCNVTIFECLLWYFKSYRIWYDMIRYAMKFKIDTSPCTTFYESKHLNKRGPWPICHLIPLDTRNKNINGLGFKIQTVFDRHFYSEGSGFGMTLEVRSNNPYILFVTVKIWFWNPYVIISVPS